MVSFQPDEVCRHQCDVFQHAAAADSDGGGAGVHLVQCGAFCPDAGEVSVRDGGGRVHHGDSAPSDHRRIPDAGTGNHRPLYRQNL